MSKLKKLFTLALVALGIVSAQAGEISTQPWLQNVYTNRFTVMCETKNGPMDGLELRYGPDFAASVEMACTNGLKEGTWVYMAEVVTNGAEGATIDYSLATNGVAIAKTKGSVKLWKDEDKAFTCAIWGDNQEGVQEYDWGNDNTAMRYAAIRAMFVHMAKLSPDFGFTTGDMSSGALYDEEIEPGELRGADDLFGRTIPYHLVWGNHDCIGTFFGEVYTNAAQRYFAPAASEEDGWFHLYRNDVLFIGVHWTWGEDGAEARYDAITNGVAQLLKTDRAKNAKFRILVQHAPIFLEVYNVLPKIDWFSDTRLLDVAKAGGVDLVLSGHTHAYERIERDGIVQVVNGGMGYLDHGERWYNNYGSGTKVGGHQNTPLLWARQTEKGGALAPAQPVRMGCFQGYGMLKVEGDTLTYTAHAFDANGSYIGVADTFELRSKVEVGGGRLEVEHRKVSPFTPKTALKSPISNTNWAEFKASQGESWKKPAGVGSDDPVVNVSKTEIERFCAALNEGQETNYRLPTVKELTEIFGGDLKREVSEWTSDIDPNTGWCRILGGNKKAVDFTWCRAYDKPAIATADCHANYLGFRVIDAADPIPEEMVMDRALAALEKIENPAEVYLWSPFKGKLVDISDEWTKPTTLDKKTYGAPVIFTGKGPLVYRVRREVSFDGGLAAPNATALNIAHVLDLGPVSKPVTIKVEFRGGVSTNEWTFALRCDELTFNNVLYRGQALNVVTDSRALRLAGTNDFSGAVMTVCCDRKLPDPFKDCVTNLVTDSEATLKLRGLHFSNRGVVEEVLVDKPAGLTVGENVTLVTAENVLFGIDGSTLTVNGALDAAGIDIEGHLMGLLPQEATLGGSGKVTTTHFGMCDVSTQYVGVAQLVLQSAVPYRGYGDPASSCNVQLVEGAATKITYTRVGLVDTSAIPTVADTTWKVTVDGQEAAKSPVDGTYYVAVDAKKVELVYTINPEKAAAKFVFPNGTTTANFPLSYDEKAGQWYQPKPVEKVLEATKVIYNQRKPDYTQAKDWVLNHYLKPDEAKSIAGEPSDDPGVDLIYVYGTIAMTNAETTVDGFADIEDPQMRGDEATHTGGVWGMIPGSVKAFSDYTRVYMPFYRQMTLCGATNVMAGAGMEGANSAFAKALQEGVAYEDVEAALDAYFEKWNQGRPFILAGCSQGAAMLRNMIENYFTEPENMDKLDQLVACYGIAFGVTKDWADGIKILTDEKIHFATNATERGVYISWNTVGPDSQMIPNGLVPPNAISINPLTWTTEATPADAFMNYGALTNAATGAIIPHLYDATVDTVNGVVVSTNLPASDYVKGLVWFGDKSLHTWEMAAWWENIRDNAYRRIETATGKRPRCGTPTDYAKDENWMVKPETADKAVDVFFLYPTTDTGKTPNLVAEIDDAMKATAWDAYPQDTMGFWSYANMYAPYYRQASFLGLQAQSGVSGLKNFCSTHVVKTDVFAALDYYFTNLNVNAKRPFILVGHSQGSCNIKLFFEEYLKQDETHQAYKSKLVAAYAMGFAVEKSWCEKADIEFAEGESDTGKILTWNCEGPDATHGPVNFLTEPDDGQAINPLNWKTDDTYAPIELNLGSVVTNAAGEYVWGEGNADAQLSPKAGSAYGFRPGALVVTNTTSAYSPAVLGYQSYHGNDGAFFQRNVGVNGFTRYAAFVGLKPVEASGIPTVADTTWQVTVDGQEAAKSPADGRYFVPEDADPSTVKLVYTINPEKAAEGYRFANGGTTTSFAMKKEGGAWVSTATKAEIEAATKLGKLVSVSYLGAEGNIQTTNALPVAASGTRVTWNAGWYVVNSDIALTGGADCSGAVNLILADTGKLTINGVANDNAGIKVSGEGNSLAIYGQALGMGALNVNGGENGAGIGGGYSGPGSNIRINGGTVTATGGNEGAGIGGGSGGVGSYITINGGTVTANGDGGGAGIGNGFDANESASKIFIADDMLVKARAWNTDWKEIPHTGDQDIAGDLEGKKYVTAEMLPPVAIVATPTAVKNATFEVYTNGFLSAEIESGKWAAWSNRTAKVVYTADAGYMFADGSTVVTNDLDTSVNPAVNKDGKNPGPAIYTCKREVLEKGQTTNLVERFIYTAPSSTENGGVFRVSDGATLTGTNVTFDANETAKNGGAIYNNYGGTVALKGATFKGNKAEMDGGAIYNSGTLSLDAVTFEGNEAAESGGAISNSGTVNFDGAVTLKTESDTIKNSMTLNWNLADGKQGVLNGYQNIINSGSRAKLQLTIGDYAAMPTSIVLATGEFSNIKAAKTDTFSITNVDQQAAMITGVKIDGDIALSADGLTGYQLVTEEVLSVPTTNLVLQVTQYTCKHTEVTPQMSPYVLEEDKTYTAPSTKEFGGVFSVAENATLTGTNVTFDANETAKGGGAICNSGTVALKDTTFKGNAANNGGAISNRSGAVLNLDGVTFEGNTAKYGGAIYNEYGGLSSGDGTINLDGPVTLVTDSDTILNYGPLNWNLADGKAGCLNGYQNITNAPGRGTLQLTVEEYTAMPTNFVIATGDFTDVSGKDTFTVTNVTTGASFPLKIGGSVKYVGSYAYSLAIRNDELVFTFGYGKFEVEFCAQGGKHENGREIVTNDCYVNTGYELPMVVRKGYVFQDWCLDHKDPSTAVKAGDKLAVMADHSLYAIWTPNAPTPGSTELNIPDVDAAGKPVTNIAEGAYNKNTSITDLVTPLYLDKIEPYAFQNCTALKSITITAARDYDTLAPKSVTIAQNAFAGCASVEELYIAGEVTSLGQSAFQNCEKLRKIVFGGSNAITFGTSVFRRCGYKNGAGKITVYMSDAFKNNNPGFITALGTWFSASGVETVLKVDALPVEDGIAQINVDFSQMGADRRLAVRVQTSVSGKPDVTQIDLEQATTPTGPWTALPANSKSAFADGSALIDVTVPDAPTLFLRARIALDD